MNWTSLNRGRRLNYKTLFGERSRPPPPKVVPRPLKLLEDDTLDRGEWRGIKPISDPLFFLRSGFVEWR